MAHQTKYQRHYDECPQCGTSKMRKAKLCSKCRFPRTMVEQPEDSSIRYIPLTKGQFAIIDGKHFERISGFIYCASWNPNLNAYYAVRTVKCGGKTRTAYLHRDIMGLNLDDPRTVDHALHNTLDNREFIDGKVNLRFANHREQILNRKTPKSNTSGFKGVSYHKGWKGWIAQIRINGKSTLLGKRLTAEAAWRELYVPAALLHHGEFANI